jgi:hypothetical protein
MYSPLYCTHHHQLTPCQTFSKENLPRLTRFHGGSLDSSMIWEYSIRADRCDTLLSSLTRMAEPTHRLNVFLNHQNVVLDVTVG